MPINFSGWIDDFRRNYKKNPGWAVLKALYYTYLGVWYTVSTRRGFGENIYECDWDLLIILDACRVDALREVSDEYNFIGEVDSVRSVGSTSHEWMAKTFICDYRSEIEETAHITANGYAYKTFVENEKPPSGGNAPFGWPLWKSVDQSEFSEFRMVWQDGHDDDLGNVPPRVVTDHTVSLAREKDHKRILTHYVQPHAPYMARAMKNDDTPTEIERDPMGALRDGRVSKSKAWELYLDNLRFVLDEVDILLDNIDAEDVVITADHGEAFGEHGAYDHPDGFPFSEVKRVPWVETTAKDRETYHPEPRPEHASNQNEIKDDLEDHLHDLGYM